MSLRLSAALLAFGLVLCGDVGTVLAGVEGKSYSVTVRTNFTSTFTDILTFESGGSLVASSGATGLWTETDHGAFSMWTGNLSTISLSGVQIGPLLLGSGGDAHGHQYLLYGSRTP